MHNDTQKQQVETESMEIPAWYKKKNPHCEDHWTSETSCQESGAISLAGIIQDSAWQGHW